MNSELRQILSDLKVLSERSHWKSITDLIEDLQSERHSQDVFH